MRVCGNITAVNTYAVILPLLDSAQIVAPCYESRSSPEMGEEKARL